MLIWHYNQVIMNIVAALFREIPGIFMCGWHTACVYKPRILLACQINTSEYSRSPRLHLSLEDPVMTRIL